MYRNCECREKNFYFFENRFTKNSELIKYDINYPQIYISSESLYNKDYKIYNIQNLNNNIYNYAIKFKELLEKMALEYKEKNLKYQVEGYTQFFVTYNEKNTISILVEIFIITKGFNKKFFLKSYNWDTLEGKELKLKDLFIRNVDYKKLINNYIKNKNLLFHKESGFDGISENQKFYITNNFIIIYLEESEKYPEYICIPKIRLEIKEFKDYLNKDYIHI
ncbi:hypothetical protein [Paraclostridium sordellii]|uniref:hypothetical protein n=1 Tax=Paraclostridium sordellii TaxID=1505 RepID=UPI0005E9AAB8|nr:hypothetical protein [Paeniclostridium sordellii]CEO09171.1 Protein of uncharacterised function (DUF3298) [[Clostridium] sordellii] [Paeniclostridium sordellii]CEP87465.1 Protein of uncharacterised function (DUF3298) [[Clostridium] sordellii] [Paeniclostridium sordellii]CEP98854.1 Protein of uncharacterised function (DUF3298) [[Clostridium] sordellii] [Paeniclostridium sordellii]